MVKSRTGANALITSVSDKVTSFASVRFLWVHFIFIDIKSFPICTLVPISGQKSTPIAFTAPYTGVAAPSSGRLLVDIQFGDNLTLSSQVSKQAANRFRSDAATVILADPTGDIKASVSSSSIAIASPILKPRVSDVAVTDASSTSVCHDSNL